MKTDIQKSELRIEKGNKMNSKKLKIIMTIFMVFLAVILTLIFCKINGTCNVFIGVGSSLVASVIFYIIMDFFPGIVKKLEKAEEQKPLRIMALIEINEYYIRIVDIWHRILTASNYLCPKYDLNKMFSKEAYGSIKDFDLLSRVGDESIPYKGKLVTCIWKDVLIRELEKASKKGETILNRYVGLIPEDISYAIYKLQNHNLMGNLPGTIMDIFDSTETTGVFTFDIIIIPNEEGGFFEANSFLQEMKTIDRWIDLEKRKLQINEIDIQLWR